MKKLLILGHAQHGKDTTAEILQEKFNYNFESSSIAAARIFLYDELKNKYGYTSPEECYLDRINHRAEWYTMICEYNKSDRARLAKDIMQDSNIYVGMRDNDELQECLKQNVFDIVIGVYDPRKPLEDTSSFNIDMWKHSDIVISNAGTLEDLNRRVGLLEPLLRCQNPVDFFTTITNSVTV